MDISLYKLGPPGTMIKHIRQGHQNTILRCKDGGQYGHQVKNNVGVFQRSAPSALLFIIYLEDMTQDYTALNDRSQLCQRRQKQIAPETHSMNIRHIMDKSEDLEQHENTMQEHETLQRGGSNISR